MQTPLQHSRSRHWRIGLTLILAPLVCAKGHAATDSFSTLFPGFVKACATLHDMLVPFALVVMVLSFAFQFWNQQAHFLAIVSHLTKLFFIVLLINHSGTLINDAQALLQEFLDHNIPARAENISELYRNKLAEAQLASEQEDKGFFDRVLDLDASLFESLVAAVLTLISWAGLVVIWAVYLLQKIALCMCWAISPLIFGLFSVPPVAGIALRHLLRIIGILLWPIGLALSATISEGLIDGMVKDSFLKDMGLLGAVGYGFNNILALAVLSLWIIGSSLVFPLVMSRIIGSGAGAATVLTRTGDLTVNLGAPTLTGLAMAAWAYVRSRFRRGDSSAPSTPTAESPPPTPVPAMPPDTSEPPPTALVREFAPESTPDDSTGDPRSDEVNERLNDQSPPHEEQN